VADQNPYAGLRAAFLTLGSDVVDGPLRGAMIEFGMPGASVTIVCVADGTTSMYTSVGGGMIGAGQHEQVRRANAAFRAAVSADLDRLTPVTEVPLPEPAEVNIAAVTADGLRLLHGSEVGMAAVDSPDRPLFMAGQDVVTQLRLLGEKRPKKRKWRRS
jgi:hypothetical protein